MNVMKYAILSMVLPFVAEAFGPGAGPGAFGGGGMSTRNAPTRRCPCTRLYWDNFPRSEFNPPEDIATLPEREQLKFIKIFRLVPDQVKVKSTQNYTGRIAFMNSQQYASITNKLAAKLARSTKMLATEPAITAAEVQKMCFDTIVYGRSLTMGRMEQCSFVDLAARYHFKKARNTIEALEDNKNFRHGLKAGYPHQDPECRDFETLARAVNFAQWRSFLERVDTLMDKNRNGGGAGRAPSQQITKKQLYDRYDDPSGRPLPEDLETLPNRQRLRMSKVYNLLPAQVLSVAGNDYARRRGYLTSQAYANLKKGLTMRLTKNMRTLAADPAVEPEDILKMCDEMVRFGRPLVFGDMRDVSLSELASRYGFKEVEKFALEVEDGRTSKTGFSAGYPKANPEFWDYAVFAQKACPRRWAEFRSRLDELNKLAADRKTAAFRRK